MVNNANKSLNRFIKEKPYLIWYSKNYNGLSEKSIIEAVLNNGNWDDINKLNEILGLKKMQLLFNDLGSQKRVNLRKQTVNYFSKYFKKYA